ncbi:phospholipase D [Exophiala viscosa]|uniref:phospholipase D n=1 Tax=Exophiala viscosa TaxID=2486360 RepID=UPI00218D5686|nr:phospholipase D [Exophiala viscosa]
MSHQPPPEDDGLAYGNDYSQSRGSGGQGASNRSLLGGTFQKIKSDLDRFKTSSSSSSSQPYASNQAYYAQNQNTGNYSQTGQSPYGENPNYHGKPDMVGKLFGTLQSTVHNIGTDVASLVDPNYRPSSQYGSQPPGQTGYPSYASTPGQPAQPPVQNRFDSFASEKPGNDVKWYVDGCGYFWAVSQALEAAKHSIWILDWWLSPELYLRRPPSQNEQWRLDRTLQRAAQRGVRVHIIVYKEVTQALTLSSAHTKHELEKLSPNISVFRHPDHLPDFQTGQSSLISSFEGLKLDAAGASRLGAEALKGIYGITDDVILYWAHHEKLCIIDSNIAFLGGLDLCFGRWDTNQHAIADAHPLNINETVFPGQDYNNARVADFSDVANPFQNKLDRTKSSRMGWSDISLCIQGPTVPDLGHHFIDRWNFIFDEKYNDQKDPRYYRIIDDYPHASTGLAQRPQAQPRPQQQTQNYLQAPATGTAFLPPPGSQPYSQPAWQSTSRPHTPNTDPYHVQNQPQSTTGSYTGYDQVASPPPPSQTAAAGITSGYGQGPSPSYQGTQAQPVDTTGGYSSAPSQGYQQNYPPPPPIPAPQPSPGPAQGSTGYHPAPSPSPNPTQTYSSYSQAPTELSSHQPVSQPYQSPPSQPYQPPAYQQSGTEQSRGLEGYEGEQTRGSESYGYGNENDGGYGSERGLGGRIDQYKNDGRRLGQELSSVGNMVSGGVGARFNQLQGKYMGGTDKYGRPYNQPQGPMICQMLRSCTKWSNGSPLEHSIQNAYIDVIRNSQHFVYIENQFFITATGEQQKPVQNLIGQAIVERILRAARSGQKYKVMVVIPAVPAFAGDLRADSSLGTRAIMEFQYNSINRGGHSIMEKIAQAGYNPMDYIRFYNLRNYDRINSGNAMRQAEQASGVSYEDARKQHGDMVGAGYGTYGGTGAYQPSQAPQYQQYQAAAQNVTQSAGSRWDTVSECYMLGGHDIRTVPWDGPPEAELDAFVSEELYIHTKCLIADDRFVICGSANLNDRSQLGSHDSEIALFIHDSTPVQTYMGGQPYTANRFAASLRRQLFRKHLGLIRPQNMQRPDANFERVGVPNAYVWDTPEDNIVSDPLSDTFQSLWNSRARTNTDVFRQAFRAVPDDNVTTWEDYKEFYEYYFHNSDAQAQGKPGHTLPPRVEYGHVVRDEFPGGVHELKELLSQVKGTLVEMPLCFLQHEDIAKEGLTLNPLTEEIYT